MPFNWDGYLSFAKELKTRTDGQAYTNEVEAMQRSALSRVYYSMFHLAEDFAKANLGYVPNQNGPNQAHSDVRSLYQRQRTNPDHQEVRKMLARMHKARIDSDYKPDSLGDTQKLLTSIILEADKMKDILR